MTEKKWGLLKLARLVKKHPDGFGHSVRNSAKHLLRGFTEDEIVGIFCSPSEQGGNK